MLSYFGLNEANFHLAEIGLCRAHKNVPKGIYLHLTVIALMSIDGYFLSQHARSYPFFAEFEILPLVLSVESVSDINLFVGKVTL
jgi:hypothetical protein